MGIPVEAIVRSKQSLLIAGQLNVPRGPGSTQVAHFFAWNPLLMLLFIGAGDANKKWASGCFKITEEDLGDESKMVSLRHELALHGVVRFSSAHALRVDATRLEYLPFAAPTLYADIARTDVYAAEPASGRESLRRH